MANSAEHIKKYVEDSQAWREQQSGQLDVPFGPGADQVLDLFSSPDAGAGPAPIQVFIHGGYWKSLSKDEFSYVARAFTPKGSVTAVLNYGLIRVL